MKYLKKFIIFSSFLLSGCLIIGTWCYFQGNRQKKKTISHLVQDFIDKKNPFSAEKEQLTSYFSSILISFLIVFCLFAFLGGVKPKYFFSPINSFKNKDSLYYIAFAKMVLEMFVYEYCMTQTQMANNLPNEQKYAEAKLDNTIKEAFLNEFLFDDQDSKLDDPNKSKVRQEAHKIIYSFLQKAKIKFLGFWYLVVIATYFLSFGINLLINFLVNGKKTWKRLKFSDLWLMIPNIEHRKKRILSYLFFLISFGGFFQIIFVEHYCFHDDCPFKNNFYGRFRILRYFVENYRDKYLTEFENNDNHCLDNIIIAKNGFNICHVDKKHLGDFDNIDEVRQQGKQFISENCKKFLNFMQTNYSVTVNDGIEQQVFSQINKFLQYLSVYLTLY